MPEKIGNRTIFNPEECDVLAEALTDGSELIDLKQELNDDYEPEDLQRMNERQARYAALGEGMRR